MDAAAPLVAAPEALVAEAKQLEVKVLWEAVPDEAARVLTHFLVLKLAAELMAVAVYEAAVPVTVVLVTSVPEMEVVEAA